jgi:hypothetical protein
MASGRDPGSHEDEERRERWRLTLETIEACRVRIMFLICWTVVEFALLTYS